MQAGFLHCQAWLCVRCLCFIEWRAHVGIPIIILREEETRFFPWDFDAWKANKVCGSRIKNNIGIVYI